MARHNFLYFCLTDFDRKVAVWSLSIVTDVFRNYSLKSA